MRYGSSRSRTAEIDEIISDGDKLEFPQPFARGAPKASCQSNATPFNDEVELVTYAQGTSIHEVDTEQPDGILRTVEVTHKVSFMTENSDVHSKAESQ